MKKLIVILVGYIFLSTACTVNNYYGEHNNTKQDSEKSRIEAKKSAEIYEGHTQMYFSEDHKFLFIDLSIDPELGDHVTTLDDKHSSWQEANIKKAKIHFMAKVDNIKICNKIKVAEIDNDNNLIRLKLKTEPFEEIVNKGKTVNISVTCVGDGKWHFLIGNNYERSPFSSQGNTINEDYHLGASISNWKLTPYEFQP